jgi:hypothetical protein
MTKKVMVAVLAIALTSATLQCTNAQRNTVRKVEAADERYGPVGCLVVGAATDQEAAALCDAAVHAVDTVTTVVLDALGDAGK